MRDSPETPLLGGAARATRIRSCAPCRCRRPTRRGKPGRAASLPAGPSPTPAQPALWGTNTEHRLSTAAHMKAARVPPSREQESMPESGAPGNDCVPRSSLATGMSGDRSRSRSHRQRLHASSDQSNSRGLSTSASMHTPTLSTSQGRRTASCRGTPTCAISVSWSGSPARFSPVSARALQDDAMLKAPAGSDRTISTGVEAQPRRPARSLRCRPVSDSRRRPRPHLLDPNRLPDYIDALFRAAWALCGSRHDAEDLVQETFATVLTRPRLLRDDNEIGYLLRALRNTYADRYRTAARRPATRELFEDDAPSIGDPRISARDIMQAIASAPAPYRDAVIAVDLVGLSYREAARSLHTREATLATRLYRGRQHVAGELIALV